MRIIILLQFLLFSLIISSQNNRDTIQSPSIPPQTSEVDDMTVYEKVDTYAIYPGGNEAMYALIRDNLKYPTKELKKGIQGRTTIQVTISKTGEMSDYKIHKSSEFNFDKEALRVVKMMQHKGWTPAQVNGKNVNSVYNIPFAFRTM